MRQKYPCYFHMLSDSLKVPFPTPLDFLMFPLFPVIPTSQFSSVQSFSRVRLLATPWSAAYQAPPYTGFSRQEYRSELLKTWSVQFSSVAQSCLTLCDPMNHSMPGLPVHHQLLEFTQIHVHQVSDAIQPSHPRSSPSPPAPSPSQHQILFQ